jgi:hypothetical protein
VTTSRRRRFGLSVNDRRLTNDETFPQTSLEFGALGIPLDFIARLATLVPSPRVNLTWYHGIFAPHHRLRAQIVPSARGAQTKKGQGGEGGEVPSPRHVAMTWA